MNNNDIRRVAIEQSADDMNCNYDDFISNENKVIISVLKEGRKKYYKNPHFCEFVCYGNALVASVDTRIKDYMVSFVSKYPGFRCCEQFNELTDEFKKYGKRIGIQNYYLPDISFNRNIQPDFDYRIFVNDEIEEFYTDDRFHMALKYNKDPERKDRIAVVGYKQKEILGIAGATEECDKMWQVGIDVIDKFRNHGIATGLVQIITKEILRKGIVPYYATAWAHIASRNVAINCGYKPSWVEVYTW